MEYPRSRLSTGERRDGGEREEQETEIRGQECGEDGANECEKKQANKKRHKYGGEERLRL